MVVGAAIGLYAARVVQMTQMPELVALMHSLVGLAAMLVGYANFIDPGGVGRAHAGREHDPRDRDVPGRADRRGDVLGLGDRVRQAVRARSAASRCCCRGATGSTSPACSLVHLLRLPLRQRAQRRRGDDADDRDDGRRAALRRPHGDGDRRRRHAGRGVDAQQLLGLGGGGDRLHAEQRPPDRRRRAGRLAAARSCRTSCARR